MPDYPGQVFSVPGSPLGSPQLPAPSGIIQAPAIALDPQAQDLYAALDRKHPDYAEYAQDWRVYGDLLGETRARKEDYLPRNTLEWEDQYAFRVLISEFVPETPDAIARLVGGLYKTKPTRKIGASQELSNFVDSATPKGESMDRLMARVMRQLIAYGSTRVLVNVRYPDGAAYGALTRAQEKDLGIRPRAIVYSPLSIVDWDYSTEDDYTPTMVRIKECRSAKRASGDPYSQHARIERFIQWTPTEIRWWTFEGEAGKRVQVGEAASVANPLGRIPLVVYYWPDCVRHMIGLSYIRLMARGDVAKFRSESDREYDTWIHAHPLLKVHTSESLDQVGVGTGQFLRFEPETAGQGREDAEYLVPPESAFTALRAVIDDKQAAIQRHSGMDPTGQIEAQRGVATVSGVSRAWSFGTSEENVLSDLSDAAVDIEHQIFDLVLRWYAGDSAGDEPLFRGEVQYPEEFDVSSSTRLLDESERVQPLINSPTLHRTLHKRYASAKIADSSARLLKKVHDEIDRNPLLNTQAGRERGVMDFPRGGGEPDDGEGDDAA